MLRAYVFFKSPRLALGVLAFLAAYCAASAWFPWMVSGGGPAPAWAGPLGLAHPFTSPLFLLAVGALFLSTLACLWSRTPGTLALWRGAAVSYGVALPARPGADFAAFLASEGFGTRRAPFFRFRHALWGGIVLHVGLVSLIAGIAVQQSFHDGGAFELAEGETLRLSSPGAVFAREHGPLAPFAAPDLTVGLLVFDPFLHQPGYAPDRASRVRVERPGRSPVEGSVDRAEGFDVGALTLYQAIPTGLALNLELQETGARSFHLRSESPRSAAGEFTAPGGVTVRLGLEAERVLDDAQGTGIVRVWIESDGVRREIAPGRVFLFGHAPARLVSVGRWAGFTYARSPGLPAVHTGFALVLLGAALLVFPAGVAQPAGAGEGVAGWVYVTRGREVVLAEWARRDEARDGGPQGG